MTFSSKDAHIMRRAIHLAQKGGLRVFPNPRVGCALAREGNIVATGYHAAFGGPHAEAMALAVAGTRARGATAYVTLEPCCHLDKKTPPCAQALVRAGVKRVVVGCKDPNPGVAGRGLALLARAGVLAEQGLLERPCRALIREFSKNVVLPRPYVVLKVAASLDGKIATSSGESKWITSGDSRRLAHRFRAEADAVLAGIGTVLADDPSLTAHGAGRNPLRAILDARLRIPPTARVLDATAPTVIFTVKRDAPPRLGNAWVLRVPAVKGGVDLNSALSRLAGMGIGKLLVEGGGRIHTAFLSLRLVDELRLFLAPRLIGGSAAPGFFQGEGSGRLRDALLCAPLSLRRVGADLLVRARVRGPAP